MERRILILSAGAFAAVLLAGAFFQPGMLGRAASDDPAAHPPSRATGAVAPVPDDDTALSAAHDNGHDYEGEYDDYDDDGHEDDHEDDDHDDEHEDDD